MDITELSKRITALREAKGYSVNALANRAGISQSFLRDIELGKKNPTVETMDALCWALDISLKDFFDVDNDLLSDELKTTIYKLNPEQRRTLLEFLKTVK